MMEEKNNLIIPVITEPNEEEMEELKENIEKELSLNDYFVQFGATLEAAARLITNRIFKDELTLNDPKEQRQWMDMYFRLLGQYKQKEHVEIEAIKWQE